MAASRLRSSCLPKKDQRFSHVSYQRGNKKCWLYLPEGSLRMATKDRTRCESENDRTRDLVDGAKGAGAGGQFIVKFPHQDVIRMLVRSMVRLVEYKQADVAAEADVAVAECIEEHVGRADDDAVRVEHAMPQLPVSPLVRFVCAGNEADGDGEVSRDDCLLLPRERDCRCEEPGDLRCARERQTRNRKRKRHTLGESRSVSRFIRRTAIISC